MGDEFKESAQLREAPCGAEGATVDHVVQKSYAARVRMIIALSLLCWAALLGVVALMIA